MSEIDSEIDQLEVGGESSDSSLKGNTNFEKNIFYLFTVFFIFIIFNQLDVSNSFNVNEAVRDSINDNENPYTEAQTLEEFYTSFEKTIFKIYRDQRYNNTVQDVSGTQYRNLNNYNYVVSTVRVTQRRIKMKNNTSSVSKKFIPEIWAGEGIIYSDSKKSYEMIDYYGPHITTVSKIIASSFFYKGVIPGHKDFQSDISYENKGGYVINIDVYNQTYAEVSEIMLAVFNNNWLDAQTASLILDFTVYNPYLQILTYTQIECTVNLSGRLFIEIDTESIKRSYYSTPFDIFRCVLEFIFLIIC